MSVPVDCDYGVDWKATHPTLLGTNQDNEIEVPPQNWNITKSYPSLVRMSVLENGIDEDRWDLARVPRQRGFLGTARENVSDERYS